MDKISKTRLVAYKIQYVKYDKSNSVAKFWSLTAYWTCGLSYSLITVANSSTLVGHLNF